MAEYIKREKAVELIENYGKGAISDGVKSLDPVDDIFYLVKGVKFIPAVDVAPVRHGKWEQCYEDWRKQMEGDRCSDCGFEHYGASIMHYHYCPNCGAKMDGEV